MLQVKKEFKSKIIEVKLNSGRSSIFDGRKDYTQKQLQAFSEHEKFKDFIEKKGKEKEVKAIIPDVDTSNVQTETSESSNFSEEDLRSMKVSELREMFPDVEGKSKNDLIQAILGN